MKMKRKFVELEVDTELTNKELKVKDLWKAFYPLMKIIQITVNTVKKGGK
jgi:hypothetical protein